MCVQPIPRPSTGAGPGSGPARKRTVDFGAAVKLVDAARAAGVDRYVMISALGADRPDARGEAMRPYFEAKRDGYPVQEHFHYAKIYRRQVVKQADLVLALWWCAEAFTPEQTARDLDYYEQRTVRDSSLSACVQAVSPFSSYAFFSCPSPVSTTAAAAA